MPSVRDLAADRLSLTICRPVLVIPHSAQAILAELRRQAVFVKILAHAFNRHVAEVELY